MLLDDLDSVLKVAGIFKDLYFLWLLQNSANQAKNCFNLETRERQEMSHILV